MKKMTGIVWAVVVLVVAGAWWAWGRSEGLAHDTTEAGLRDGDVAFLEQAIPYDFRLMSSPAVDCEALEVELIVVTSRETGERRPLWRVWQDNHWQMSSFSFEEIYHRYDGPPCYDLRVVTVDSRTGYADAARRAHVCLK